MFKLICQIFMSITLLFVWGCSDKSVDPESEATELGSEEGELSDQSETVLLSEGKRLFESEMYTVARDSFEALRNTYPLSPHAEFAEIKVADCDFEMNEFDQAAKEFEEFAKNRPSAESLPYALMMAGRSNQMIYGGVGRDISPLKKANQFYDQLITLFPESPYAANCRKFKLEAEKSLVDHDRFVLDFYRRRDKRSVVEIREVSYRQNRSGLKSKRRELKEMEKREAQLASQIAASADISALTSSDNDLDSDSQQLAHSRAAGGADADSSPDLIRDVECRTDKSPTVFLYLNSPLDDQTVRALQDQMSAREGGLSFPLPSGTHSQARKVDCFGSSDMEITDSGLITLKTAGRQGQLMALNNPARLLLVLSEAATTSR